MKVTAWILGVLAVLAITAISTPGKNFVGSMLGYGGCPNCGNSWLYTESGGITYEKELTGSVDVMICKKCLSDPAKLNADRIGKDLLEYGWETEKVNLAKLAINELKPYEQ